MGHPGPLRRAASQGPADRHLLAGRPCRHRPAVPAHRPRPPGAHPRGRGGGGVSASANGRPEVTVGLCQWLASPGRPEVNLAAAAELVAAAAGRGAEVVVLPELWASGYDAGTLAADAARAAEPLGGPRTQILGELARQHHVHLFAGTVPEAADRALYNTALLFDPQGELIAAHRKAHLYPFTGEDAIFGAGDRLTVVDTDVLGRVGLTVCFDGDFPEVPVALNRRGAGTVVQPCAYEAEASDWWDRLYPAAAVANGQWWILANQCGTTATGTLLGASRVIDPAGRVVAEARRVGPGGQADPEVLLASVDTRPRPKGETAGVAALRRCRRPELYAEEAVADRQGEPATVSAGGAAR
ncbi:hypothetical protein GHK86_02735 [Acidimicrobiaceae bacterium USS-CC1]|uniref:CN hydrolase domain-containing protein n=1 Tax=Acidiferrimicrobium australe TaxID=2664430 RepID=A0ABW9QPB3_9ACTN|nr:hypothetical protein [Acidiferrimicrobium australe]